MEEIPLKNSIVILLSHIRGLVIDSLSFLLLGDYEIASTELVIPSYPTPSGLTEDQIYSLCKQVRWQGGMQGGSTVQGPNEAP